jgi:hypothetical protein
MLNRVRAQRWFGLAALALAIVALAGCGGSSTVATGTPGASLTPLPTYDATQAATTCGASWTVPGTVLKAGDLLIGPIHLAGLAAPASKLPDDTPQKPLEIQFGSSTTGTAIPANPPVNPTMDEHVGGYEIDVCNISSSQSHTLSAVSVRIDNFSAYNGTLNEWNSCNGAYSRAGSVSGCGGAYFAAEYLHASFDSAAGAGTIEVAQQVSSGRDDGAGSQFADAGPLPLKLDTGKSVPLNVGMTVPTAPGTYSFSLGLAVDGGAPVFVPAAQPVLFAPAAHQWGAAACETSDMQAQIPPATDPPNYYICPEA